MLIKSLDRNVEEVVTNTKKMFNRDLMDPEERGTFHVRSSQCPIISYDVFKEELQKYFVLFENGKPFDESNLINESTFVDDDEL